MGSCTLRKADSSSSPFADVEGPDGRFISVEMPKDLNDFEFIKLKSSGFHSSDAMLSIIKCEWTIINLSSVNQGTFFSHIMRADMG